MMGSVERKADFVLVGNIVFRRPFLKEKLFNQSGM